MAYTDIYDQGYTEESTLWKQVVVAMITAAAAVVAEDPGTANHAERLVWAQDVQSDIEKPKIYTNRWMHKVVENSTISAAPATATDNDVQFVVNGLVDTMAGV